MNAESIKEHAQDLADFLSARLGDVEVKEGTVEIIGEKPVNLVKTYVKKFLHKQRMRKTHRIAVNEGVIGIQNIATPEDQDDDLEVNPS